MRNTLSYHQTNYENDKIKSAQMAVDTSLNERVLDVDTMHATVESETALVPFQQNTPVRFLRGGSQYALWYLAQITRVAPKLWALSMTSSLGRLTQMPHKGGIYNGVAASAIIDDICGVVPHFVGAAFSNVLLYGWLPYVAPSGENGAQTGSAKDNLLKVLFALNATVRDDADGTLRIENLSTAVSAQLEADRIYRDNASVVTEPTVTAVTVLEHQYITGSETTTLFEGTTVDGQVIVFREPMSNLTATGFTVTESNANYAVVSAGSGTLTGTPYIHTTREITKPVTAASIPNAVRIEDATLVGVTNSAEVVNRLVDYYSHRTYINVDATIDFEDAGDVVEIYDPFDKVLRQACIEKISPLVVSQTMKGRVSALVGFTPWQVVQSEDVRELLTGSGTWTAPADLLPGTEVTVVLISKGADGLDGAAGGDCVLPSNSTKRFSGSSGSVSGSNSIGAGTPGQGGDGGTGGSGGKIYRGTIQVNPGETYAFSCGSAETQDATTFGSLSSENGAASDAGYFDPVVGVTYGKKGVDGADGGNGGSPGSAGGDVGNATGGAAGGAGGSRPVVPTTYVTQSGSFPAAGGGGAGGNSGATDGENGTAGEPGRGFPAGSTVSGSSCTSSAEALLGGNGGNGADGADGANYGDGGAGGGGGGGAGANGSVSMSVTFTRSDYSSLSLSILCYHVYGTIRTPPTGGAGGSGGAGAPGCGILYYRRPVAE